ncbi:MAG: hypothetical protein J0L56_14910 [Chitinophagales bacterium]|nr:hypothetical protein [Chitinophagales bacterium]
MNVPGLRIVYWAYSEQIGVEDLAEIDKFRAEIGENYASLVKVFPHERGGEVFQFAIEFFADLTLKDYLTFIGGYIAGKAVDKVVDPILDAYLFNPLKKAYKKLKEKNPDLGVYKFSFDLSDTKITIYHLDGDQLLDNIDLIIREIGDRYKELQYLDELPMEIHIPVIQDDIKGTVYFRPPFEMDEKFDMRMYNYTEGYWGLKLFKYGLECIYSLEENKIITDIPFYTEEELYSRRILEP